MTTIIINQAAVVAVTLKANGNPVAVPIGSTVTAQLFDIASGAALSSQLPLASTDAGSDWAAGLVSVALADTDTAQVTVPEAMLVIAVNSKPYRFRLLVEMANAAPTKSALFVRDFIVDEIREDRLYAIVQGLVPGLVVTDDYIWGKIIAAESSISHTLRVKLCPTQFFPLDPTAEQLAAIGDMPWALDPAYDYDPDMFQGDKWGFIVTRQRPIIKVQSLRYVYPSQTPYSYDMPLEWLRFDKRFGQVRIVPSSIAAMALTGAFMMQLIGAGRMIPHVMHLTYVAGLENAARDYPELLDAIKKLAVLKIIEDAFLPSSGSISADGLSQSMSVDVAGYHAAVDGILNGTESSGNGGLMAAIHGIRLGVM